MTPTDSMHKAKQDDADFEAMLDRALRARSQAGPRAGFHHRLAESLRQHADDSSTRGRWWNRFLLLPATVTFAVAVASVLFLLHHRPVYAPTISTPLARNSPIAPKIGAYPAMETARMSERRMTSLSREHQRVSVHVERTRPDRKNSDALSEALPKLDTFPSIAHHAGHPFGSGDPPQVISAEAANAMLSLRQQQARPIVLSSLNINAPLFGEKP